MRTEEIKILEFKELSKKAKDIVIEQLSDININHDWWDGTEYEIKRQGGELVAFDTYRKVINIQCDDWVSFAKCIVEDHGEDCETYKTASEFLKQRIDEDEFIRSISNQYLSILEREYEYLISDRAVVESIESNDYEFYEDGRIYQLGE